MRCVRIALFIGSEGGGSEGGGLEGGGVRRTDTLTGSKMCGAVRGGGQLHVL